MTETRLHDPLVEREEPVPYRGIDGLRVTARSRGQRAPRNYIVRAPNGELCQLGEEEHFLLTMLDGKRSFREIEQEFRARFAGNLSRQHFEGFIEELQSTGIIERIDPGRSSVELARDASAPLITVVEEAPPGEPVAPDWTGDVVPADETVPLYHSGLTLAPVFSLLARLGSPLRYFAWFLLPAVPGIAVALYLREPQLSAALSGLDWAVPGAALFCTGAALAALIIPNLARGAAAAFHGAPREVFQLKFACRVLPWFRIDRGWVGTLSRKAQAWTYATPLVARLAVFAIGAAVWLCAASPAAPHAVAGLVAAGIGLWSFLITAAPLWPSDGRRWLAIYFDEPALDRALWHALRLDSIEAFERHGRGLTAAAAILSLVALAGAALLWGAATWDGFVLIVGSACSVVASGVVAMAEVAMSLSAVIADRVPPLGSFGGTVSGELATGAGGVASGVSVLRDAMSSAAVHGEPERLRDIGGVLLAGGYASGLLWLTRARASVGGLTAAAGGWGTGLARGELAPVGRGAGDALPPALDERLYTGGQSWPSNTKVLVLAALVVVVLSVAFLSYPYESGGNFTILPYTSYEQNARVSGEVTEVLVREGERVKEGQVLAILGDWNEVHSLAVSRAALDKASAQLQDLLQLPKPEQVALARQQYEQAASRLPFSKADYDRDLALVQTGAVSVRQFQQTQSAYEQDKAAVAVTKANYDLVRAGATASEIEAARAAVRLAQAQVAYAEDQLARTRIRASASGTVVTPNPQLMYGKYLKQGQPFVALQDNRVAHIEVQIPETDIRDIYVGSRVRAKAWGYERMTWTGKVTLIAHDATSVGALGNVVRVVAEVPNPDGFLRPQMSGYAKVQTAEMPVWVSFTRALVRFLLVEVWSWIP
jgi:multidrug resistance efflux pump